MYKVKIDPHIEGAKQRFLFISIEPKLKDDIGLLLHEIEHVKQFYRLLAPFIILAAIAGFLGQYPVAGLLVLIGVFAHETLYTHTNWYRRYAELRAFRVQLDYDGWIDYKISNAAKLIASNYNLNISQEQAFQRLIKHK